MTGKLKGIDEFSDNHEPAFRFRPKINNDITSPVTTGKVTKGEARELFIRFLQNSPELHTQSRDEQIREFNRTRRQLRRPMIAVEILQELLVKLD